MTRYPASFGKSGAGIFNRRWLFSCFPFDPFWSHCGTANSWRKLHLLLFLAHAPSLQCCSVQMEVSRPIFLISFGRIKRHHAGLAGWGLGLERKGTAGSRIDGIYGVAPQCWLSKKNLKDKVYPSKNKTNCPTKTKPAFVTALSGRKGSVVGLVTQPLF